VEEGGSLSPHLAVVGPDYSPASFEGLDAYHLGACAPRIDELVMDLNYCMGPCGTVNREWRSCNGDLEK
jgi:hypothetical protein